MNKKKAIIIFAATIAALALISAGLTLLKLTFLESLRIVFGSVYVLFLPGFVLTYAFFKEIDWIERITLSFALSIAIVPLTLFLLNKVGVKINTLNSILVVLGIIIVTIVVSTIFGKKNEAQKKQKIDFKPKTKP